MAEANFDTTGEFSGCILLSSPSWDQDKLLSDLKEKWDIEVNECISRNDSELIFDIDGIHAAYIFVPEHLANNEAEAYAANNFQWPEANDVAAAHTGYIHVSVHAEFLIDTIDRAKLFTKLMSAACRQTNASGVYTSGVVVEPVYYDLFSDMLKHDCLPIETWVWCGAVTIENEVMCYTFGMENFGMDEMEICDPSMDIDAMREVLRNLAYYILENDAILGDGETVAFSDHESYTVTHSRGIAMPDQMTYKVSRNEENVEVVATDANDASASQTVINEHAVVCTGLENETDSQIAALARKMISFLNCDCSYIAPTQDTNAIREIYDNAAVQGLAEGYVPMLVAVNDLLLQCMVVNSDPMTESEDGLDFSFDNVRDFRATTLSSECNDGKVTLAYRIGECQEKAAKDNIDWDQLIIGRVEHGSAYNNFSSVIDHDTGLTVPLLLAKIPVENPWEVFAYLPFGGWGECPSPEDIMAVTKFWFERYQAVPAVLTHDELELVVPVPVAEDKAMELAVEQYGLCHELTELHHYVGHLADSLRQSTVWYFWWR